MKCKATLLYQYIRPKTLLDNINKCPSMSDHYLNSSIVF